MADASAALLESRLRLAVQSRQIVAHLQPQVALPGQRVVGAEALARWTDDLLGPIPPDRFIAIAEQSDLIVDLGRQMLHQACRIAAGWSRDHGSRSISVNVSAVQLADLGLVSDVHDALNASGLDPHRLTLEITETAIIQDLDTTRRQLHTLRDSGVSIALDDFGVGQSPLTLLSALPIDLLKIDRSFITRVHQRAHDAVVTRIVIDAAHSLGMQVCAEGIETPDQAQQLLSMGCDQAQGYLIARPYDPRDGASLDQVVHRIEGIDALRHPPIPVSGSDELVIVVDDHHVITYVSIGSLHLLGYTPAEMIGTHVGKYLHREEEDRLLEQHPDRPLVNHRHRARHRDGSWHWLQTTTLHLHPTDGHPGESISVSRDVTAQVDVLDQLAGLEAQFRWAFELSPTGMAISTLSGTILRVNEAFAAMLGRTPDDLVDARLEDITHPDDRAQDAHNTRELSAAPHTRQHVVKRYLHADGSSVPAELWVTTVPGNRGGPPTVLAHVTAVDETSPA